MERPVNPLDFNCSEKSQLEINKNKDEVIHVGDCREYVKLRHAVPQPHFTPGYTGYTPGSGENMLGLTYGDYTHHLLLDHMAAGGRLNRIPGDYAINILNNPENRSGDNPHAALEPYFISGYTGFIPGSGIRRSEGIGETYGRMTHVMIAKHQLKGGRLRPIHEYPKEYIANEEDVKFYCYEHELTRNDIKRWKDAVPGYAGHIPRALFRHGRNKTKITKESIAEFQKILNKNY